MHVVLRDFVFSIKIEVGEGGPSYLDEFKLKKQCEIVIRSLWFNIAALWEENLDSEYNSITKSYKCKSSFTHGVKVFWLRKKHSQQTIFQV